MADSPITTQTISNLTEKDADSVKDIDVMILEDNEDTKKITFSSVAKVLLGRIKNSGIEFDDTLTSDEIANISSGELLPSLFGKIKNAIGGLISHISNKDNPHEVTGDQINLSGENIKTAVGYTPANKVDLDQLSSDVTSQIGDLGNLTTAQKDNLVSAINSIGSSSSPSFTTEIQPVGSMHNYGDFIGGYVQIGKLVCVDISIMVGDEYYAQNLLCYGLPDPIDGYALVTVMNSGTAQYGQGYISGGSLFLNIAASSGVSLYICGSYLSK